MCNLILSGCEEGITRLLQTDARLSADLVVTVNQQLVLLIIEAKVFYFVGKDHLLGSCKSEKKTRSYLIVVTQWWFCK